MYTESSDLNALVREVVAAAFADHDITLALAPNGPTAALDTRRIRLLLRNLIDNALRHSAGAVREHGAGVDDAQLPRLAQAFYRPDSARQRATGGVGLGLYLCRLVAQARGGAFELGNARPGLQIEVRLPLPVH